MYCASCAKHIPIPQIRDHLCEGSSEGQAILGLQKRITILEENLTRLIDITDKLADAVITLNNKI